MANPSAFKLRSVNNCLFIDDTSTSKVILQHNARPGLRPYIHPLRIGDGTLCLTEDSPWHHPWQHGIQTGFHGVNGCDFWRDPGQHPSLPIGTIEPSTPQILAAQPPRWAIEALWRHAHGHVLMLEQQHWTLLLIDGLMALDLEWTLRAIPDITIEQASYGGFFIRMPFRKYSGASVLNSAGQKDDDTEQQAAAWLDLHMPLENSDRGAGIAVFDHPQNPNHPAHWRVDHQRGINPAPCIPQAITLKAGQALQYRYRLLLHQEPLSAAHLDTRWAAYAQE